MPKRVHKRVLAVAVVAAVLCVAALAGVRTADAAISVVQAQNVHQTTSTSTITLNITTTAGDAVICSTSQGSNNTATWTTSDSAGQTWTQVPSGYIYSNTTQLVDMRYVASSSALTWVKVTFTANVSPRDLMCYEVSGLASASPEDASVNSSSTGGSWLVSGKLTTSDADDILIYMERIGSNQTSVTGGPNYTLPANASNTRMGMQYKIVSATQSNATTSMTFSSSSASQQSVFAAFKQAVVDNTPPSPSPMTWSTSPYAASTSSITMTATSATDSSTPVWYLYAYAPLCSAYNGNGGTSSTYVTSTSYTDSGLDVNQCYDYTVTAKDNVGNVGSSSATSTGTAYTLANIPSAPSIGSPTTSTLLLTNNVNGNPSNTGYYVQVTSTSPNDSGWQGKYADSNGSSSASAVLLTGLATTTIINLQPNTTYTFWVQAWNGDSVTTTWSGTGSGTTNALPTPTVTAINPTSGYNTGPANITSITGTNFGTTGWDAESGLQGNWRLDETSSTSVIDSSGNNNTGTLGASSTWQTSGCVIGDCVSASGTTSVFEVSNSNGTLISTSSPVFTIALWINDSVIATTTAAALMTNETYTTSGVRFGAGHFSPCGNNSIAFWSTESGGTLDVCKGGVLTANAWHHVAATYDGTTGNLYFDGSLVASSTGTIVGNNNDFLFGQINGKPFWNGLMDEVRVYNRALSASEISGLYQATQDPSVQLTKTGQTSITGTAFILNSSTTLANGVFNITGAATGTWNVVVTNPTGLSGTLTNGFTVSAYTPTVTAIDPTSAQNIGPANITSITGTNFGTTGWDAESGLQGNWRLDETSSTSVIDSSGNGYTGVFEASSTWQTSGCVIGDCVSASGTGATFEFINSNGTLISTSSPVFTIALWINDSVIATTTTSAILGDETYNVSGFRIGAGQFSPCGNNSIAFWSTESGGTLDVCKGGVLTANAWHHVAATYDGTTGNLYFDGSLVASSTGTIVGGNNDFTFGEIGGKPFWNGLMDEVRVYNRALSASEISGLYQATQDPSVQLTKTGQTSITGTAFILNSSTTLANGVFNITGAATGTWNVVVTNPNGLSGTLANGFTVSASSSSANYNASGTLDSVTFDTGVASGTALNSIIWQGTAASGTSVGFQIAVSTSSGGPWNFEGPSGGASDYFSGNAGTPINLRSTASGYALFSGYRYFRYRILLFSDSSHLYSPTVTNVTVNWSP